MITAGVAPSRWRLAANCFLATVSLLQVCVLPHALLVEVLVPFLPATRRSRKLPAEITLQVIIAMNLYASDALTLMIGKLFLTAHLDGTPEGVLPSKSAISQARTRLGVAPVVALLTLELRADESACSKLMRGRTTA